MSHVIDILKSEHRVIQQVLDCLEKIVSEAKRQGRLEADPARDAIAFFRNFADHCHHGKEEDYLFPAMEAKGFPRQSGPTGVMLYEHEKGREHIRGMDAVVEQAATGDAAAVDTFCRQAQAYVELLREHIAKEDHCLFTMADEAFSPADHARLLAQFELVEAEQMGKGTHQRFLDLAKRLAERYDVAQAQLANSCHGCGCGHP
jgi:hemerythrin-like domain-containing protein